MRKQITSIQMASPWGAGKVGVDDLCVRLSRNDPALTSLTILAGRRFGTLVSCLTPWCCS